MERFSDIFLVALGGALGSITRYLIVLSLPSSFPWATACVNLTGAFCAGLFLGLTPSQADTSTLRLLLVTGFLGGFTTFSSFSLETLNLWLNQQRLAAGLNVGLNTAGSLMLVYLGFSLARLWAGDAGP